MQLKKQNTRTAEISLDKRGFMKIKILPDSIIDVEDALDNLLVIKSYSSGKKILKLIDLRGRWTMTKTAKEVSKKNVSAENTIARAYVIDSYLTKIMLSFFQSFQSKELPQQFFNSEEDAIKWLLSL